VEKERPRPKEDNKEELEHTVTVGGKPEKLKLPPGARLSELLKKFMGEHPDFTLRGKSILCNSKLIEHTNGQLKEDPVLVHASTVTIAAQISGGHLR